MRIGIYYDDPETVPEDQLRFAVGVVIAQSKKTRTKDNYQKNV
jgi:DNA gyrase inhibitor GyrI